MTLPQPILPQPPAGFENVFAHAPYVRGLARELVFDADLARDVEQETWLAALENEPRDRGALRGWLAALVRNFALKAWRSDARRVARERASAVREASVPSPAEILEREDLRRSLIEAVLALDEPLRSVLVLRFFEELPPREIARRLQLPVETVRTRTKRGLELLRGRLDRESEGRRAAWCLALVRGLKVSASGAQLATILVSSVGTGVVNMQLAMKLSVSAVLVALATSAAVLWIKDVRREGPRESGATPGIASAEPALPSSASLVASAAPASARVARASTTSAVPSSSSHENWSANGAVLLSVSWHDGTPAADVAASVHWSAAEDFYADAFEVRTDADGTCRFELPPTHVSLYPDRSMDVAALGSVEVLPGQETEIAIQLPRGYDVEGTVLAADGQPLAGAEIFLATNGPTWDGHVVAHSDAGGGFHIRSISSGLSWLSARAALHAPTLQVVMKAAEGTTVAVTLVSEGPGGTLQGTVRAGSSQPIAFAQVLVGDEAFPGRVLHPDGSYPWRAPAKCVIADENGHFRVDGIAEGTEPLRVRAPGYAPHFGEVQIWVGQTTSLDLSLEAGTTVEGTVTDASGGPVAMVEICSSRAGFGDRFASSRADGTFRLHSLPAGEFTLRAQHDTAGSATATFTGAPGAALTWNPVLGGAEISGTLSMPGTDLTQCVVRCMSIDWERVPFMNDAPVDAQGAFELTGLADTDYRLEVIAGRQYSFPVAVVSPVRPGGEPLLIDVDPALWPSIRLTGRVLDAQGSPPADVSVSVWREGDTNGPLLLPSADGTFECGPYPTGRYGLSLSRHETVLLRTGPVDVLPGQTWSFGDLQLSE